MPLIINTGMGVIKAQFFNLSFFCILQNCQLNAWKLELLLYLSHAATAYKQVRSVLITFINKENQVEIGLETLTLNNIKQEDDLLEAILFEAW